MICCDVNVVLAALRPGHEHHLVARAALIKAESDGVALGLPDFVLASVIRLVTNPRVFADPTSPEDIVTSIEALLAGTALLLVGSAGVWARLSRLIVELALRGNDIPDAALAAVCIENRAELLTFDRGFARFPGLRWRVPA